MIKWKELIFKNKSIGWKNINKFLFSQGLRLDLSYENFDLIIISKINRLISLTHEKKAIKEKEIHDNIFLNLDNCSYKGYKRFRGLPIFNQRTKTNSRTSRRLNS